jgi:hypothetical protein
MAAWDRRAAVFPAKPLPGIFLLTTNSLFGILQRYRAVSIGRSQDSICDQNDISIDP